MGHHNISTIRTRMYQRTIFYAFIVSCYHVACSDDAKTTDYMILGYRASGGYNSVARKKKIHINVSALLLKVPNGLHFNTASPEAFEREIRFKSLSFVYKGQPSFLGNPITGDIPQEDIVKYTDSPSHFKQLYTDVKEDKFIAIKYTSNRVFGFSTRFTEMERLITLTPKIRPSLNVKKGKLMFCLSDSFIYQIDLLLNAHNFLISQESIELSFKTEGKAFAHKLFRIDYKSKQEDSLKTKTTFDVFWALGEEFKKEYKEESQTQTISTNGSEEKNQTQIIKGISNFYTIGIGILITLFVLTMTIIAIVFMVKYKKGNRKRKLSTKYERRRTANTSGSINM